MKKSEKLDSLQKNHIIASINHNGNSYEVHKSPNAKGDRYFAATNGKKYPTHKVHSDQNKAAKDMESLASLAGWNKPKKMDKSEKLNKNEDDQPRMENQQRSRTKFIAFNANNVSEKLINHISANDHVGLQQASKNLNDASGVIASWVENAGGTVISRAVDEIIAMVPEEALGTVDRVKQAKENSRA